MEREILGYEVQTRLDNDWIPAVTEVVAVEGFEDEVVEVPIDPMPKDDAEDLVAYLEKTSGTKGIFRVEPVYK